LLYPRALAIGPNGNIYVTDNHMRVTVIRPDGHVLVRWGSPGSGHCEFRADRNNPDPVDLHLRIAVAKGLVYVADSGNARMEVCTPQGGFVRQFSSLGSLVPGNGQVSDVYRSRAWLVSPDYFAVDSDGSAYVSDFLGVIKFSAKGKPLWLDGSGTSSDPDLGGGTPGSFDSHGRLLITQDERNRIVYLDPKNGHKVDAFDLGTFLTGGPCEATVDAQGYIYVTACGPQVVGPNSFVAGHGTVGFVGGPSCDTLVFDSSHTLVAKWTGAPHEALVTSPYFGPYGEVFALGWDGSLLKLKITLPPG